jgi:hypothetical protein
MGQCDLLLLVTLELDVTLVNESAERAEEALLVADLIVRTFFGLMMVLSWL